MSERTKLTRRGLFRGVGTATLLGGCVRKSEDEDTEPPIVTDASAPAEIGPDPTPLRFTLNGTEVQAEVEPRTTLLQALRIDLDTTGPKLVCDRGACSACLVLVDGLPRNSCMMLAHDVAGREVVTVEGLAALEPGEGQGQGGVDDGELERLSVLQRTFVEMDALQCGFCTSGMLISCAALLRRLPPGTQPTEEEVREAIAGNLCRCGTYPHVVEAVQIAASQVQMRKGDA